MSSSKKIPWSNEYSIGIKGIDFQHKKLFDLVNRLYDLDDSSSKEDMRIILYEFSDYVKIHFEDEEAYMLSINYPELEKHIKIHQHIVESLSNIIHTPASLAVVKTKMRVVAKRVLVEHIIEVDQKIKDFVDVLETEDEDILDLGSL